MTRLFASLRHVAAAALLTTFAATAQAGLITTTFGSGTPDNPLGPWAMTDIVDARSPTQNGTLVTSVASPLGGNIEFRNKGNTAPLEMRLEDVSTWQPSHPDAPLWNTGYTGAIYVAPVAEVNWIELILPENTRAFSFFVGASFNGTGWIRAFDDNNGMDTGKVNFSVGPNNTPGFGVHVDSQTCGSVTRVIIEPKEWGFGQLAINQGPCGQVPAPGGALLLLLGIGALGARRVLLA